MTNVDVNAKYIYESADRSGVRAYAQPDVSEKGFGLLTPDYGRQYSSFRCSFDI